MTMPIKMSPILTKFTTGALMFSLIPMTIKIIPIMMVGIDSNAISYHDVSGFIIFVIFILNMKSNK